MFSVSDAAKHFVIWKINFFQKFAIWFSENFGE